MWWAPSLCRPSAVDSMRKVREARGA